MMFDLPLIGLTDEYKQVRCAIDRRKSALLLGAAGSGKTKVLRSALNSTGSPCVYLDSAPVLHDLLVEFGRRLSDAGYKPLRRFVPMRDDAGRFFAAQTSMSLRGILWSALENEPVTIALDHIRNGSPNTYRFLQKVYYTRGVTIIAVSRTHVDLGYLARLFWDPRDMITFQPLGNRDIHELFDTVARQLKLEHLDLDDFRPRVLEAAQGNPGQVVEMCRRAADPLYQKGRHIQFAPLRIDTVAHFLS